MKNKIDEKLQDKKGSSSSAKPRKQTSLRGTAKERLKENEERFRLLSEAAEEGIAIHDKGVIVEANQALAKMFGYKLSDMIGMYTEKLSTPESWKVIQEHIVKGNDQPYEAVGVKKDGCTFVCSLVGKPYKYKGRTLRVAVFRNITEHKKAEELLRQSELQYRLLADHMKDQVWLSDLSLNITYASPSVEKLLGYTLNELKILSLDKVLAPASFKTAMDFFSEEMPRALAAPSDYVLNRSLEMEFSCKDGHTVWVESMFSFIRDENGKPLFLLGESHDITERIQMENALRDSETNFRHSLDESPLGVRISTIEGETLYANRAILDMYGYDSVEELKKLSIKERYTPESYAEFQERKKKRIQGEPGPSEYEISIVRKNGEIRHLHVFRKEIFWDGKKQSQVIYQDTTRRKQAEEKLNRTLENLRQSIKTTIQVLGLASEARDPYTAGHHKRVSHLARAIATEMDLPHHIIEGIRMAGSIHDIGKLSVPGEILSKPTKLTELEFSLIKEHPHNGYEMLKHVESPWPLAEIVYQHHERINGTGYPRNLKVDEILMAARIMAVADVVEAMASHRPYRPAPGIETALEEIEVNKGILYDGAVVDACLKLFREKGYKLP